MENKFNYHQKRKLNCWDHFFEDLTAIQPFYVVGRKSTLCYIARVYFLFKKYLIVYAITVVPLLPLCPPLPARPHPTVSPHTVVQVHGSFVHSLCLAPSPALSQSLPSLSPLTAARLFHVSVPLVPFFSLVYFAYWIPLKVRSYGICLSPPGLFHLA